MRKTYGTQGRHSLSQFLDEGVDLIEDSGTSPTSTTRPPKRPAEPTSTAQTGYPKKIKISAGDQDEERRLLGDYRSDSNAVVIPIPTSSSPRYNHKSTLNGSAIGGLHPVGGRKSTPGYLNSTLSRPRGRPRTRQQPSFSSRNSEAPDLDQVVAVRRNIRRRRRSSDDREMSREEPVVILDDDDVVAISPSKFERRKTSTERRDVRNQDVFDTTHAKEELSQPKKIHSTQQKRFSESSDSQSEVDSFTKIAARQRRQEAEGPFLIPVNQGGNPARMSDDNSLGNLRTKFTASDGRRRNSGLESPDVLSGDATVGPHASPTRKSKKGTRELADVDKASEEDHAILSRRSRLGPQCRGPLLHTFSYASVIILEKSDYLLSLEDEALSVRSLGSRLGLDPVFKMPFQWFQTVWVGETRMRIHFKVPPAPSRFATLQLHTEKDVWDLVRQLDSRIANLKIINKPEDWLSRARDKDAQEETYDFARTKGVEHSWNIEDLNPTIRHGRSGNTAQNIPKLKDQLRTNDIDVLSSKEPITMGQLGSNESRTAAPQREQIAHKDMASNSLGPSHLDAANTTSIAESVRRTTRGMAKDKVRDPDPQSPIKDDYVPFSQTGQLGPPWKQPLVYPKIGKKRAEVEFRDLERLDDNELLNDNLIGFFLRFLEQELQRTRPETAGKIYFFNTYFFATLTNPAKTKKKINYDGVKKWTRGVNLFEHDFVIVPINENAHWYVAIICNLPKVLPGNADEEAEEAQSLPQLRAEPPEVTNVQRIYKRIDEPTEDQEPPVPQKREPLAEIAIDDTDKSFKDLNLESEEPPRTSASDINEIGSLKRTWRVGSDDKKSMSPAGRSPRGGKGKRAARRSGVGLLKYNTNDPIIMTMDSLGLGRSPTTRALREYVVEEAQAKLGVEVDGSAIRGMTAKGIPGQDNFSDCGLYLLAYMERFVQDPYYFVGSILRREMDEQVHWPAMQSGELRNRLRQFLLDFHKAQETGHDHPDFANVGRILLGESRLQSPFDTHAHCQDAETISKYFTKTKSPQQHHSSPSPELGEVVNASTDVPQKDLSASQSQKLTESQPLSTITIDSDRTEQQPEEIRHIRASPAVEKDLANNFDSMFGDDDANRDGSDIHSTSTENGHNRLLDIVENSLPNEVPETQQLDDVSDSTFEELEPPYTGPSHV